MSDRNNLIFDLTPRRKRPLALWNPIDGLTLLHWAFFYPQAFRWYLERFATPVPRNNNNSFSIATLRQDQILWNLIVQAATWTVLGAAGLAYVLQLLGLPVDWLNLIIGVMFGAPGGVITGGLLDATAHYRRVDRVAEARYPAGISGGLALGIAGGVCSAVVYSLTSIGGLDLEIDYLMAKSVSTGACLGLLLSVVLFHVLGMPGTERRVRGEVGSNTGDGKCNRASAGRSLRGRNETDRGCLVFGVLLALAIMLITGLYSWRSVKQFVEYFRNIEVIFFQLLANDYSIGIYYAISLIAWTAVFLITAIRLFDWILLTPFAQLGMPFAFNRMVWLPLPNVRRRLERTLENNWEQGALEIGQVLTYSLQFIPALEAVNITLARSSDDQLLHRISVLSNNPCDWRLLHFSSAGLKKVLWRVLTEKLGWSLPKVHKSDLRFDTLPRSACAGFWLWHESDLPAAAEAFAQVKDLPGGSEIYGTALILAAVSKASDLAQVKGCAEESGWSYLPAEEALRPGTLQALNSLHTVTREIATAHHAHTPLNRMAALGRAAGELNHLLEVLPQECPEPERKILLDVAERWRDIVVRAGGVAGEAVLREPVPNPYEGYSGLPVTGPSFVGRVGAMREIETRWATGELLPAIILYGHRRMGKTSILRNLEKSAPAGTMLVYLDMQNAGWVDHTGQLLLDFAQAIHARVTEAGLDAGPSPAEESYDTLGHARRQLNAFLSRLTPQMAKRRLILAIDEFELIDEGIVDGRIDRGLLKYLRSLNQEHRWLALIFAGLHKLEEMSQDYRSAFYGGQAEHVRVSYLSRADAVRLITVPHPDFALEYSPALLDELYRLTYGQPFLIQRLCWELVNRWNERFLEHGEKTPRTLELDDLTGVISADFYAGTEYYFYGVWGNVTDEERAVMTLMAARDTPWRREELAAAWSGDPAALTQALNLLLRHDVVVEAEDSLAFASELMRRWVASPAYRGGGEKGGDGPGGA